MVRILFVVATEFVSTDIVGIGPDGSVIDIPVPEVTELMFPPLLDVLIQEVPLYERT